MNPEAPVIRPARHGDLDALQRIEAAAFESDRLSRRSLSRFVDAPSARMLVAETAGAPAGYALVLVPARSSVARLYSLAVAPAARGRGIGAALLAATEHVARELGFRSIRLEVRADNPAAQRLYLDRGYRRDRAIEGFYEDGAPAILMRRQLIDPQG